MGFTPKERKWYGACLVFIVCMVILRCFIPDSPRSTSGGGGGDTSTTHDMPQDGHDWINGSDADRRAWLQKASKVTGVKSSDMQDSLDAFYGRK